MVRKIVGSLRGVAVIAALLAFACTAGGETLYEASLEKVLARAATLSPQQQFSFIVLGDSRGNDPVFRKSLSVARTYKPLFILHMGDFSDSGSRPETDHFLSIVKNDVPEIPFFVVRGNHDHKQVFTSLVGPTHFTLDIPRLSLRLVAIDNAGYAVSPGELSYLSGSLDSLRTVSLVAAHIPPATKRWSRHAFSSGAEEFSRLLAAKKVKMAFYGHVHLFDRADVEGIPSIISGGAGARLYPLGSEGIPVYHIVLVSVKGGTVTATMIPLPE